MNTNYTQKSEINTKNFSKNRRDLVNDQLKAIFVAEFKKYGLEKLVQAMEYTLMGNGKRFRPILTLAVYELFNKDSSSVIAPACAVELIHASTLMLDDLPCMDNALLRRGKKANHLVFGESTTILASAGLFAAAFKLLSEIESVEINELVSETADALGGKGLIKGQFMDVESFKKIVTIEELNECYNLKTSVLFYLSAKLGAVLANATKEQVKALEEFGRDLGLAFQVRDDILDVESTLQESGKDVNIDEKNEKPTYVSILGIDEARRRFSIMIENLEKKLSLFEKQNLQIDSLVAFIDNLKLDKK